MNLKHVISSLTTAVVLLAIVSVFSWFTMGKRTVTHVGTQPATVNVTRTHASQMRVK
ncbi:hypothetical protein [Levilactobacillus parabrevis]|uniref:Uncharacterized protein n=1 Tax=Levilactobacillus parabrevis ATCC 53295 TaxID=1267003 RepID=A0A0R1GQK6_9LACO|nr:hypothetical protein [Levilactobacillus parabrevis]KRK36192.1 hypothetical protein FD07_GL001051 [Levilactobacillus parabrevis ATCC 53295]KRO05573.1 hypothetical protein IV61_GL001106 [Levilactobacillus parabrevis]